MGEVGCGITLGASSLDFGRMGGGGEIPDT